MFQVAARSFWHVWSVVSAKEQKSARSARHRSFALQPANHGPSERFDAPETAGLHAAAASLPSRRGLGDDDRAAGRRHADYEYALHLNLNWTSSLRSPATVPMEDLQLCHHQEQLTFPS